MLNLTSDDLKRIFERSVSKLGATVPENPGFLQVSGVLFSVDCSQTPQRLSADGTGIAFPGSRIDPASIFVGGRAIAAGDTFKLAAPASLAGGKYGYLDLTRHDVFLLDTRKTVRQMLDAYLRTASLISPAAEGRILLKDSCR